MIYGYDETKPLPLIQDITENLDNRTLTKTFFDSLAEEDEIIELVMEEQESPKTYKGKLIEKEITLDHYRKNKMQMYEYQRQLINNYIKNVGGEITKEDSKYYENRADITIYFKIPEDAPFSQNFEKKLDTLIQYDKRTIQRYILRHKQGKKFPEPRKEYDYLWSIPYEAGSEVFASIQTAFVIMYIYALFHIIL